MQQISPMQSLPLLHIVTENSIIKYILIAIFKTEYKGGRNMGKAPDRCPMCGERQNWKLVDTANKGFSVGKAAVVIFLTIII